MKLIKPVLFQSSMLLSSTATEAYSNWSSATTYALGNKVVYGTRIYESLQNTNLNHLPDAVGSTWWLNIGPANKYAMFDQTISTGTTAGTTLQVVFQPGVAIDSLALINLDADTVTLTVRNGAGGPIVYQYTGGLSGATVSDWYQYFFYDPLLKRTQLVFSNIPPYVNCHITLDFTVATTMSVSECIFGTLSEIGGTQFNPQAGIIDYSQKNTDAFGTITFTERAYSKRMSVDIMIDNAQLNRVYQLLASVRATPSVWIGSDNPTFEEPLIIYGFYRNFTITIPYVQHSMCSMELEGLT